MARLGRPRKDKAAREARSGRMPTPSESAQAALEHADRTEEYDRTKRQPEFVGEERGPAVSVGELAKHLDLTPSRISNMANSGLIVRNIDGSFPLDAARISYIRAIRRMAATRAGTGDKTTGLIETKTLKAKLELAVAQGSYVNIDDVEAILTEAVAGFRNHLSGIGASVTRDLAVRARIEEKINDGIAIFRNAIEAAASAAFRDSESDVADEEAAA